MVGLVYALENYHEGQTTVSRTVTAGRGSDFRHPWTFMPDIEQDEAGGVQSLAYSCAGERIWWGCERAGRRKRSCAAAKITIYARKYQLHQGF